MPRQFKAKYVGTFVCDYCGRVTTMEISASDYENMGYVSGYDKVPAGWIQVHYSPDRKVGKGIPTHFFDSLDHVEEWKNGLRRAVEENVSVINA